MNTQLMQYKRTNKIIKTQKDRITHSQKYILLVDQQSRKIRR